jgi:hypothetical protein
VEDVLPVGAGDGIGDLGAVTQDLVDRQRPLGHTLGQRLAFEILHDEEVDTVLMADVVEDADVWMVEGGDGLGLALETGFPLGVL